jgi:hypothetical protein
MAITTRTNPAGTPTYPTDYTRQNELQQATQRGYTRVGLDSYADGATAPEVVVGSEFEIDGDVVTVTGTNESIGGLVAIANDNDVYIYFDVSAGTFEASTTAPTFNTALGGWYNGDDRALFKLYKDGSGEYDDRFVLASLPEATGLPGNISVKDVKISGGLTVSGNVDDGLSYIDNSIKSGSNTSYAGNGYWGYFSVQAGATGYTEGNLYSDLDSIFNISSYTFANGSLYFSCSGYCITSSGVELGIRAALVGSTGMQFLSVDSGGAVSVAVQVRSGDPTVLTNMKLQVFFPRFD